MLLSPIGASSYTTETSISLYWVVSAGDIKKNIWEHVYQVMSAGDTEVDILDQMYLLTDFKCVQSVSRLVDITAGGDFLGLCDQKRSYKHVSDFGWLRSYDRL